MQRRPAFLAGGLLLVLAGSCGAVAWSSSLGDTTQVLAVKASVPRGAVITDQSLIVANAAADPSLVTVPAADRSRIVGQRAAADLSAGTLLTPTAVTSAPIPADGQAVVGVAVTYAQLPAMQVKPGDHIRIVSTPGQGSETAAKATTAPASFSAVVVGVQEAPDQTGFIVDVTVADDTAANLAAQTSTGRVAIVLDPPTGTS